MLVKLSSVGHLDNKPQDGDSETMVERPAMLVYQGVFDSMDGEVEVSEHHIENLARSHNSLLSKFKRLAGGNEIPMKALPPLQVDHSRSGWDTVGRVVGNLSVGVHTLESGKTVKALFGRVRVLGKDNVERVTDGRWTNLSIGADLDEGRLTELSITPFPAAAEASMLRKSEENKMGKLVSYLMKSLKLSKSQAEKKVRLMTDDEKKETEKKMSEEDKKEDKLSNAEDLPESKLSNAEDLPESKLAEEREKEAKMKKKLMEEDDKLSEEDAGEKLAKMTDDEKKELSARCAGDVHVDVDSHEGEEDELAGEDDDEEKLSNAEDLPESKLNAAAKKKLTLLAKDFRSKTSNVTLAARKLELRGRIARLQADAKITPAEAKKFFTDDRLTKLAKSSKEAVKEIFDSYEAREPVIMPGMVGSAKAENLATLSKDVDKARLEAETRARFTSLGKKAGSTTEAKSARQRLSSMSPEQTLTLANDVSPRYRMDYEGICRLMDEGHVSEAKVALKKMIEDGVTLSSGSNEVSLSSLAEEVKSLENMFEQVLKLVAPEK